MGWVRKGGVGRVENGERVKFAYGTGVKLWFVGLFTDYTFVYFIYFMSLCVIIIF